MLLALLIVNVSAYPHLHIRGCTSPQEGNPCKKSESKNCCKDEHTLAHCAEGNFGTGLGSKWTIMDCPSSLGQKCGTGSKGVDGCMPA